MQKQKILLSITRDQYEYLKQLVQNTAFELDSFKDVRPGDERIVQEAEIAGQIEKSLEKATLLPQTSL